MADKRINKDELEINCSICFTFCFLITLGCKEGKDVFDECGQRCKCIEGRVEQCARIRKEFTQMTMEERELYVKVIKTASTDPLYKKEYDNLIRV